MYVDWQLYEKDIWKTEMSIGVIIDPTVFLYRILKILTADLTRTIEICICNDVS